MRRLSWVFVCLLALTLSIVALPPAIHAADGCSHVLIQEDAAASGFDCPELPTLDQAGFVRPAPPAHAKRGRVREIVDGDTIKVSFGDTLDTVRIVNINTPETHAPNEPKQCYGDEAAAYIATLIPPGTLVWLERDQTDRDRFDRLLRHVWFEQGAGRYRLLGDAMVRDGYAETKDYPPDLKYSSWLHLAQDNAVAHGRGLWSACGGAEVPLGTGADSSLAGVGSGRGQLNAPTPTPASPPPVAAAGNQSGGMGIASGCAPSYPDFCIPPPSQVGDLDCKDVAGSWFTVYPPDPHNFDRDGDGVGCESG